MFKKGFTFIAGFIVGILVVYGWEYFFDDSDVVLDDAVELADTSDMQANAVDDIVNVSTDAVVVQDQSAGEAVHVDFVNLVVGESGGWVVVHEIRDGVVANALGATRKDGGVYDNVAVNLLRETVAGNTYAVVLYSDDGDKQFSTVNDSPIMNENGEYVMSTFVAK